MEKMNSNKMSKPSEVIFSAFKSRFFLFVVAFVCLIIASNNYSKRLADKKIAQQTPAFATSSEEDPSKIREDLVKLALQQLGRPYTPAGKSPSQGFDCSGFTQYVFKTQQIEIPASSLTQSQYGKEIDLSEAKKGDLVFFKSPTEGNDEIGHVGIVISDEGNKVFFVHSSTNRGVVIDSIDHRHYQQRYRSARRVIE